MIRHLFATKTIHAAQPSEPETGSLVAPIFQTSTYQQEAPAIHHGFDYSRTNNPTRQRLEAVLAELEGVEHCALFASGLAAENAVLQAWLKPGDEILIPPDVYGGTYRILHRVFAPTGCVVRSADFSDLAALGAALSSRTKIVWLESPTNHRLLVYDIAAIAAVVFTDGLLRPEKRAVVGSFGDVNITTNMVQWAAIGIGLYCVGSWMQTIRLRDPASFALVANPAFISLTVAGGLMSYISYGLSPFIFLYAKNSFGVGAEAGITLGAITAIGGGLGTTFGGILGDWLRKRFAAGRVMVMLIAAIGSTVTIIGAYNATDLQTFYILSAINVFVHIMWLGPCAASVQDLVLPRMRGTSTAVFFLGTTILGLGLGPYLVGLSSDVSGDLRLALMGTIVVMPIILACILIAMRAVPRLEATVVERARAAGEAV